jgi:hypothetical protein
MSIYVANLDSYRVEKPMENGCDLVAVFPNEVAARFRPSYNEEWLAPD